MSSEDFHFFVAKIFIHFLVKISFLLLKRNDCPLTMPMQWHAFLEVRLRVIHTWGHIIEHTQSLHLGVRSQIVQSLHLGVRSHPRWS